MKKYIKIQVISLFCCLMVSVTVRQVYGQTTLLSGSVFEKPLKGRDPAPLTGASIFWKNTTIGTTSALDGSFSIESPEELPAWLMVSYVGYQTDSIEIRQSKPVKIFLKPSLALQEVTIEGRQESTKLSTIQAINVEQVTQKELLKAACCNLSESFETNPSVNVSYSDAITGAKEIQMLGLSGIYSQMMTENIPNIRGLASTYGLSYIPGTWMESIQITKGSGSVANGFESTTGQINVEYQKPEKADNFYLNLYGASSGNMEINTHKVFKVSDRTRSMILLHGENMQAKLDHQHDHFLDMPLVRNINGMNRWSYNDGKRFEGQAGVKILSEDRRAGQTFYQWKDEADTSTGYGVRIRTNRVELFTKNGVVFPEAPWKSVGLILSGTYHDQDSYFGLKTYRGIQNSFYGSLIYMSILGTTNHKWKAGIDYRVDDYNESYINTPFDRRESIPGVYAEYTLNLRDKFGLVAGNRLDYHNKWGLIYTPRLHVKYNFTPEVIVRLSGGRSFRTANIFADNISIMASSRNFILTEKLQPERAWNFGGNITGKFRLFYREGSVSTDYYETEFSNQVIIDPYSNGENILIYNLSGRSYSKSFQVSLNYEVFKRFDVRLAYKNDRVVINYMGVESRKPLVPENRALINLAYASRKDRWTYDFTLHYQGKSKLAIVDEITLHPGHSESQVINNQSPEFITINAQVTRKLKNWDIYLGGENLTNFRQENPVLHPDQPFSRSFDATNVWGPVMGRKFYLGVRLTIN